MRVYLDNCCYNRPYDDQSNLMISIETQAKLAIQQMIQSGEIELIWSEVLCYENNRNPFIERKVNIAKWQALAIVNVSMDDDVIEAGRKLLSAGLKQMDALHEASAIKGGADYFITVFRYAFGYSTTIDKGILKCKIHSVKIKTPYGLLEVMNER